MKIGTVESLELLFSDCASNHFFATIQKSPALGLFQENVPSENIVFFNLHESSTVLNRDESVILKSDLGHQFQKRGITHLLLNDHSSEHIEFWAKENNILLLSTPWKLQKKWENKLFFDKFLETHHLPKPRSWILRSEQDLNKPMAKDIIIQIPWSWGSQGTFFVNDKSTLQKIFHREQKYAPLLCREYINGIPLGVTLLIGAKNVIFSALRLQAFFLKEDGKNTYLGIQWLRTDAFNKELIRTLNAVFQKFSKLLQKSGFRGVANLDFLVRENQMYIVECNPRLSAATAQLTLEKSLFHGYDFSEQLIIAFTHQELITNAAEIPDSLYEGVSLDLDGVLCGKMAPLITRKSGVYQFWENQITHISPQLKEFAPNSSNILLYHSVPKEHPSNQTKTLGMLMTHFPLFKVQDTNYTLSQQGKDILNIFQ